MVALGSEGGRGTNTKNRSLLQGETDSDREACATSAEASLHLLTVKQNHTHRRTVQRGTETMQLK